MTMRRRLSMLVGAALAAAVLPAAAGAVTIQEFSIEPGAAPGAHAPYYLKAGPDGNLWIVDRGPDNDIERVTTSGQRLSPINAVLPQDIAVGPSGTVYWTESFAGDQGGVGRHRVGSNLLTLNRQPADPFGVSIDAYAIAMTPAEEVFTTVRMVSPTPAISGSQAACLLRLDGPLTCAWPDPLPTVKSRLTSAVHVGGREFWVAGFEENMLRMYTLRPGTTADDWPIAGTTLTLPPGSGPSRMALGPDGNLWIAMFTGNRIDRFNLRTAQRTPFPLPPGLKGPNDITVGPDGALWFTEFQGNAIGRITTSGQITEFPVPTPASAPYGITTGPDGAIWFTQNAIGGVARLVLDRPGTAGGPTGGGGGVSDQLAPRFEEGLSVSRSSFRAGTASGRGTSFAFSLSEPARVAVTIARKRSGRRVNGRCVAPTSRNRRRSRCDRYVDVGTLRVDGRQGGNAVRFSGRLNGRNLSTGSYRASAVATDAAGNASRPSRVTFTVRRR
jgi:streptogramin lyase